jgi:hypothetical protein
MIGEEPPLVRILAYLRGWLRFGFPDSSILFIPCGKKNLSGYGLQYSDFCGECGFRWFSWQWKHFSVMRLSNRAKRWYSNSVMV